jgi:hypothetical protein
MKLRNDQDSNVESKQFETIVKENYVTEIGKFCGEVLLIPHKQPIGKPLYGFNQQKKLVITQILLVL